MPNGLRTTFWVHAVVALIFGIGYLFLPTLITDTFQVQLGDPIVPQMIGVLMVALCVSSVLAALAHEVERVDIVLKMEVVFTILATLVFIFNIFANALAAINWVAVAIFAIFAVVFGYYYLQLRSMQARPERPAFR